MKATSDTSTASLFKPTGFLTPQGPSDTSDHYGTAPGPFLVTRDGLGGALPRNTPALPQPRR
jgi:hypothetical protein